jgi:hypothetical protein
MTEIQTLIPILLANVADIAVELPGRKKGCPCKDIELGRVTG